jgi:hypothetical protein
MKQIPFFCAAAALAAALCGDLRAGADKNPLLTFGWAEMPANLRVGEYLALVFQVCFHRDESNYINSFSSVNFNPAWSAESAILVVQQAWNDSRANSQDLRREIRKAGESQFTLFKAMCQWPSVQTRWTFTESSGPHFIVRHFRASDFKEVLGVTVDDATSFDEETIKKTGDLVKQRGGVWSL